MGDNEVVSAGRNAREDGAALLDVDESSTVGGESGARESGGNSVGEGDSAEVGESDERAAFLEVLNDPLRVLLAKTGGGWEGLRHGLSVGLVLDHSSSRLGSRRGDGDCDSVSGVDADAGEVDGSGGKPFEPG